jgi:hypothetical protein
LNEFELKRFDFEKSFKKKKRKENLTFYSARPANRPIKPSRGGPPAHSSFYFSLSR